jgi:hypothetical protein
VKTYVRKLEKKAGSVWIREEGMKAVTAEAKWKGKSITFNFVVLYKFKNNI